MQPEQGDRNHSKPFHPKSRFEQVPYNRERPVAAAFKKRPRSASMLRRCGQFSLTLSTAVNSWQSSFTHCNTHFRSRHNVAIVSLFTFHLHSFDLFNPCFFFYCVAHCSHQHRSTTTRCPQSVDSFTRSLILFFFGLKPLPCISQTFLFRKTLSFHEYKADNSLFTAYCWNNNTTHSRPIPILDTSQTTI